MWPTKRSRKPVTIRPLADRDSAQYAALDALLRAEGIKATSPAGAMPGTVCLVAEAGGVIVGRARVVITGDPSPAYGHIGLAVHPGHRRHGYAAAMMRQCVAILAAAGVPVALVACREGNAASAALIEQCGGVLHGTYQGRHTMRQYLIDTSKEN